MTGQEENGVDEESEYEGVSNEDSKRLWSLVCSTKDEWEELAEKFSKSQNRDEKNLHKTLTVDFLAEISRMLEAKVCFVLSFACQAHRNVKLRISAWLQDVIGVHCPNLKHFR